MENRYSFITNKGGRKVNEDSCSLTEMPGGLAAIVADGLGGEGRGDIASGTVVRIIGNLAASGMCRTAEEVEKAVLAANEAVCSLQSDECRMMSTLVALFIEKREAFWVHVGDSRLYLFVDGHLKQQTCDHSVPQMAVAMGMISPDQIRTHKDRSRILKAVGSDACEPEISARMALENRKSYAFLLCSDGFWEHVYEDEMESILARSRNPRAWLKSMEQLLQKRVNGDYDNYTAVAVFL